MPSPVIEMFSSKHSGVSGLDTQLFCQHSGETPLRGGYAYSLTKANNADPSWFASWPSFVDPVAIVRQIAWPNSAWTQGIANHIAVGLECAGYARFSRDEWLTPEGLKQLENLAHEWVFYWRQEEAVGNVIPLRWLTDFEVLKALGGDTSVKGFCTHKQIDPASRTDPGPNFPYDRLLRRIAEILNGKVVPASTPITASPKKKEADPMPSNIYQRYRKNQKVAKGKWKTLSVTPSGYITILNGNQAKMSVNYVTVKADDLPREGEMHLRLVVVDYNKGKPTKVYRNHEYIDVTGSGGSTRARLVQPSQLPKGSNYRLRLQVLSSHDINISDVHIDSLTWKD